MEIDTVSCPESDFKTSDDESFTQIDSDHHSDVREIGENNVKDKSSSNDLPQEVTARLKDEEENEKSSITRTANHTNSHSVLSSLLGHYESKGGNPLKQEKSCTTVSQNMALDNLYRHGESSTEFPFRPVGCVDILEGERLFKDSIAEMSGPMKKTGYEGNLTFLHNKMWEQQGVLAGYAFAKSLEKQSIIPPVSKPYEVARPDRCKTLTGNPLEENSITDTPCGSSSIPRIEMNEESTAQSDEGSCMCYTCGARFEDLYSLALHVKIHTRGMPHQCHVCDKLFINKNHLSKHMMHYHPDVPYTLTSSAENDLSNVEDDDGGEEDTCDRPFQCSECEYAAPSASALNIHVRTHTGEKPYKCTECDTMFSTNGNLVTHMRIHTGEKPYKCTVCERGFSKSSDVTRHMYTHSGEKPHICSICGKAFSQKCKLSVHVMRVHTGVKPYSCYICNEMFGKKSHVKAHMKKRHRPNRSEQASASNEGFSESSYLNQIMTTDIELRNVSSLPNVSSSLFQQPTRVPKKSKPKPKPKPYKCTECGAAFRTASKLNIHVRSHTGEKPFECPICHAMFSINSNLNSHIKTHSGERPFKCPICDKAFTKKSDVSRHMTMHTGERSHICPICGKGFSQKAIMKTHMKIHTGLRPHNCHICGRSFCQRGQLTAHMDIHTDEKRHQCSVCGKTFRASVKLDSHFRIHTGEKPYKCPLCDKAFREPGYLRKHMRSHTPGYPSFENVGGMMDDVGGMIENVGELIENVVGNHQNNIQT